MVCPRQVASTISTVGSPAAGAGWERSAVASRFLEEVCMPHRARSSVGLEWLQQRLRA